jgi:hypothetical protein
LVFGAVTCAFFFPLFRGDTFSDVAGRQQQVYPWAGAHVPTTHGSVLHFDQADSFYPWQVFMSRVLRDGHFPLWNPYSFGGTPFFANGQSGVLYPPRLALAYTVSPTRVHDLLLSTHLFLAGVAMFLLLGYVGLSFPAALVGGLAWMLNSFALAWQALEHYPAIEVWLPVAVLLAHAAVRRRSWPAVFGLALVLALLFVGGNALFVELAVVTIFGYAITLAISEARLDWRALRGATARLVAAAALFAGLIAVSLLPTIALTHESARVSLSYGELGRFALPWDALANVFKPPDIALGDPYHKDLFAGTAVGLLALVGVGRRNIVARFATVLAALTILFMLHTPVTFFVDHLLPGFGNFKPLGRAAFLLQFALAVLAAFGLETLLGRLETPAIRELTPSRILWGALGGAVVGFLIVRFGIVRLTFNGAFVLALAAAITLAHALDLLARGGGMVARKRRSLSSLLSIRMSAPSAALGAASAALITRSLQPKAGSFAALGLSLASAAVLALAIRLAARREEAFAGRWRRISALLSIRMPFAAVVVVAVVAASIVGQAGLLSRMVMLHQPDRTRYLYPKTPLIRDLSTTRDARFLPTASSFNGATPMIYPLQSESGYESLLPERIQNFWRVVGDGLAPNALASQPLIYAYDPQFELAKLRPWLLARAGVQYVVTPPPEHKSVPFGYQVVYAGSDGRVLRVPDAVPRAFLVTGCRLATSPLGALRAFISPTFDPFRTVVLEDRDVARGDPACPAPAARNAGTATVLARSTNTLDLDVQAKHSAWLVVAESWEQGWSARVDGRRVGLLPGNYAMRAVRVSAGRHRVSLRYRPRGFGVGLVVAFTTLAVVILGLALFLVVGRVRLRRPRLRARRL